MRMAGRVRLVRQSLLVQTMPNIRNEMQVGWLLSGPNSAGQKIIPINKEPHMFSKGNLMCNGYGYHNSKGALCMDDTMKTLLRTRGMNATG